ncbi:MAG TPA: hypothetical protein VHU85_04835 [Acidimicrobiales bacterium]|nr:hypothetical protein [Acidimicrobiales bacterium]
MAKPGLSGLDVDALGHEGGSSQAAEIMEGKVREACLNACWSPGAFAEVGVLEIVAVLTDEDPDVGIGDGQAPVAEVSRQHGHELVGDGQRSAPRPRLRRPLDARSFVASGDLLGHGQGGMEEIDPSHPEPGTFAPAEPEHGGYVDHWGEIGANRFCQSHKAIGIGKKAVFVFHRRELDVPTRRPADQVDRRGMVEDCSQNGVVATNRCRGVLG